MILTYRPSLLLHALTVVVSLPIFLAIYSPWTDL
jgi:hypothetical protein